MNKKIYNIIVKKRNTYNSMINYCCDNQLILNNTIINYDIENWEVFAGSIYNLETGAYEYIYQYYIIAEYDAIRLSELTNETVLYNNNLDIYLLAVKHFGTSWDYVSSNWKSYEEMEDHE